MRRAAGGVLLAAVLVTAGCTSDDDGGQTDGSSVPTSDLDAADAPGDERPTDPTRASALIARPAPATDLRGDAAAASDLERIDQLQSQLDAEVGDDQTLVSLPGDVLFDFDDDAVARAGRSTLADVAELIELEGPSEVLVEGHTDAVGSAGYNQDLSQRRAASVARVLSDELGIDAELLTVRGLGFDRPVVDETTASGDDDPDARARNRRVEITLVGTG